MIKMTLTTVQALVQAAASLLTIHGWERLLNKTNWHLTKSLSIFRTALMHTQLQFLIYTENLMGLQPIIFVGSIIVLVHTQLPPPTTMSSMSKLLIIATMTP